MFNIEKLYARIAARLCYNIMMSEPDQNPAPESARSATEDNDFFAFLDGEPLEHLESSKEDHQFGAIAHLAGLAGFLVPYFGMAIGPLVVWVIKKEHSAFIAHQSKEALNFQITCMLLIVVGFIPYVILGIATLTIGFYTIPPLVMIIWLITMIRAAMMANKGVNYRYRWNIRFVK